MRPGSNGKLPRPRRETTSMRVPSSCASRTTTLLERPKMSRERSFLTADLADMFKHTIFVRHRLEEQYRDMSQQSETASFGMWLFLSTEVMFFGTLFVTLGIYRYLYAGAFEKASERLNWQIGSINTLVLLVSSLT